MAWRTSFSARTFVGQASLFILCLGSELVTKLAFGKLDSMPKSLWLVVPMFGTVQNSSYSLEMLLAKTLSSCTTFIEILNMRPWKMKIVKLCFLTYVKKGKRNEVLKYSLKSIRKGLKKQSLKICYIKKLLTLLKINMSRMKVAIRCAFKHW